MPSNLVHNYEIFDIGRASGSAAVSTTVSSYIYFDPSWFDGATYYFELVGFNNHASNDYDVTLVDTSNSNAVLATITMPHGSSVYTRYRSTAFTPATGKHVYAVSCVQTAANYNLRLPAGRIVIVQANATKTRLQIPLEGYTQPTYVYNDGVSIANPQGTSWTVGSENNAVRFLKTAATYATMAATPWTFEAVLASNNSGATAYAELRNLTDSTDVAASEVNVTGTTLGLVEASFADNATNWHDGDEFAVYLKCSSASYRSILYRAALYVTLDTDVTKGEVFLRPFTMNTGTAAVQGLWNRVKYDADSYSTPVLYFEATGLCADNADAVYLQTAATNDSGTSNLADIAAHNWNSATKTRYRSTALSAVTDGYRILARTAATTGTQTISDVFLVVAFTGAAADNPYDITATTSASSLISSNIIPLRARSVTTSSAAASLTTTTVTSRYAYKIYGVVAASLTTSSSSILRTRKTTTTTAGVSLTTSSSALNREGYVSTTAIAASLSAASASALRARIMATTTVGASLTTENTIVRRERTILISSSSASLSVADSVSLRNRRLTTIAAEASITATSTLEHVFFTYALPTSCELTAGNTVLNRGTTSSRWVWFEAVSSDASLVSSTASLVKLLTVDVSDFSQTSSFSLTTSYSKINRDIFVNTIAANIVFSESRIAVQVVAGETPATIYLGTFAASATLTTSSSSTLMALNPLAALSTFTASDSAIGRVSSGIGPIIKLTTYESTCGMNAHSSRLTRLTQSSTVEVSFLFDTDKISSAALFDPSLFDPLLFSTVDDRPAHTELHRARSVTTTAAMASLYISSSSMGNNSTLFTKAGSFRFSASHMGRWRVHKYIRAKRIGRVIIVDERPIRATQKEGAIYVLDTE